MDPVAEPAPMKNSSPTSVVVFGVHLAWLFPFATGLLASAILLVDYVRPAMIFCEEGGGCDAVRHTIFAAPFGVPTPVFGVLGFATLSILALLRGSRVRLVALVAAIPAALVAAFLLAVQQAMGVFCKYCVVVDLSALLVLIWSLLRYRKDWDPSASRVLRGIVWLFPLATFAIPMVVGFTRKIPPPKRIPLPDLVKAEMAKTPRGRVTIVDFADFECPWCRLTHTGLAPAVRKHASEVRVVRKQVPLAMHLHAMFAAQAAVCGEKLGRGEEIAEALFQTPPEQLTPDGCEKIAVSSGLSLEAFRTCVADPSTQARILSDKNEFRETKARGLPTLWIDEEMLSGAQTEEQIIAAIERGLAKKSLSP